MHAKELQDYDRYTNYGAAGKQIPSPSADAADTCENAKGFGITHADAEQRIGNLKMQEEQLKAAQSNVQDEKAKLKSYLQDQRLSNLFRYHSPTEEQNAAYIRIRHAARNFASTVLECTPEGADQSEAIRLIRTAVMTANAAVALEGKS